MMKKDFCEESKLLFAAVFGPDGAVLDDCGDRSSIPAYGFSRSLFESAETRKNLAESIRKEGTPQIWSQGDVNCCVQVTKDDQLLVVWARTSDSPGADYDQLLEALANMSIQS